MANVIDILPEVTGEEMQYIQPLIADLDKGKAQNFAMLYRARRKDPQTVLLLALLGFVVVAGVHRFVLGQVAMGLLYLFTAGLCFIGTIVDLVNYRKLAFEYNRSAANQVIAMVR